MYKKFSKILKSGWKVGCMKFFSKSISFYDIPLLLLICALCILMLVNPSMHNKSHNRQWFTWKNMKRFMFRRDAWYRFVSQCKAFLTSNSWIIFWHQLPRNNWSSSESSRSWPRKKSQSSEDFRINEISFSVKANIAQISNYIHGSQMATMLWVSSDSNLYALLELMNMYLCNFVRTFVHNSYDYNLQLNTLLFNFTYLVPS